MANLPKITWDVDPVFLQVPKDLVIAIAGAIGVYSLMQGMRRKGSDHYTTAFLFGALAFVAWQYMGGPLELRYYDATSRWIGGRAEWQIGSQRRVWTDVALVDDERDRPDAGASSLTQFRVRAGVNLAMGSGADRPRLPPARPTAR